jgi:hypothetical protein
MPDNDEPIPDDVFNRAAVAQHVLALGESLTLRYGPEATRAGLLIACSVFAERVIGHAAMLAELNDWVAKLTESPSFEDVLKRMH